MISISDLNLLTTLFESATEQAQQLFQLLEQEQQALLVEDHDSLESLIEQKLRISQSLDHIEIQRQEILLKAGINAEHHSMQEFLLANQDNSAVKLLLGAWNHLIERLKKASVQNQLNGILLEKQRQHVKQALGILFEQSNSPAVYDASGGTTAPQYTRSVGIV